MRLKKKILPKVRAPKDSLLFGIVMSPANAEPQINYEAKALRYVGDAVGDQVIAWHHKYKRKFEKVMGDCYKDYLKMYDEAKKDKPEKQEEKIRFLDRINPIKQLFARAEAIRLIETMNSPLFAIVMTPLQAEPILTFSDSALKIVIDAVGEKAIEWHQKYNVQFTTVMNECHRDYLKLFEKAKKEIIDK